MSAHTPGPWVFETANGRIPIVREMKLPHGEASVFKAVLRGVCVLDFGYGHPAGMDEANAHLIAAAPDLLAACKAVLACDTWHDHEGHAYLRVNARSLNDLAAEIAAIVVMAEGR